MYMLLDIILMNLYLLICLHLLQYQCLAFGTVFKNTHDKWFHPRHDEHLTTLVVKFKSIVHEPHLWNEFSLFLITTLMTSIIASFVKNFSTINRSTLSSTRALEKARSCTSFWKTFSLFSKTVFPFSSPRIHCNIAVKENKTCNIFFKCHRISKPIFFIHSRHTLYFI